MVDESSQNLKKTVLDKLEKRAQKKYVLGTFFSVFFKFYLKLAFLSKNEFFSSFY